VLRVHAIHEDVRFSRTMTRGVQGGNMAVAASGQGGLLVRVDPAESEALVASSHARHMEMRGRQMQGWLRIDSEHLRTKRELATWVERGAAFARSLPAKR
jgi:hypothetical protein